MNAIRIVALALIATPGVLLAVPVHEDAPKPPAREEQAFDHTHAAWTRILAARVKADGFDYAGLLTERAPLDAYVRSLEAVTLVTYRSWDTKQQFAFWIDAYNAWTVRRVLDGWPVKSIRDLGDEKVSVWDQPLIPLGKLVPSLGKDTLTLNDVENRILRPTFHDPRVHAAINCASKSCPPLRAEAFTAEKLDSQLDAQVKAWLTDGTRNRFDAQKRTAQISKVFEWFADDFKQDAGSVLSWIARHRPEDREWLTAEEAPKVTYLEYDWAINQSPPR